MMETRVCLRVRVCVCVCARVPAHASTAHQPVALYPRPRLFLFLKSQRHRLPPLLMALVLQDGDGGL